MIAKLLHGIANIIELPTRVQLAAHIEQLSESNRRSSDVNVNLINETTALKNKIVELENKVLTKHVDCITGEQLQNLKLRFCDSCYDILLSKRGSS